MIEYDAATMKEAMRIAGVTAEELAKMASTNRVSVARWALGLPPSDASWEKVVKALVAALVEREREAGRMLRRLRG